MSLSGGDVMSGLISGGANFLSEGFLGNSVNDMMKSNLGLVQLALAALLILCLYMIWHKEGFGEGGKNVERQTMDQSYFVPPPEYSPAAQAAMAMVAERKEGLSGRSSEGDASYSAQSVAGSGSGVTSLADLLDQQARAKFLADNSCNKRGLPYMGDPWTWMVDASKAENYMGKRVEHYKPVSDMELAVAGLANQSP
jgi:hypothetical protein